MGTKAMYQRSQTSVISYTGKYKALYPSISAEEHKPFLPYTFQTSRISNLIDALSATMQVVPAKEVCVFYPGANTHEMLPLRELTSIVPNYNLCVMPTDGSWLLNYAGNKCWQWGKQHDHAALFYPGKKRFFIHWGSGGSSTIQNIIAPLASKMEASFDPEDLLNAQRDFRNSASDSFIYIVKGKEVWIEICMRREENYYTWQCITHNRELLDPWRVWFNHY